MAKSNYLSGLLLLALVWVYLDHAGNYIGGKSKEQGARSKDMPRLTIKSRGTKNISQEARMARVKMIYDSQIGVREQGLNGGPQVEKYLRYAGLSKGQPWCAAFVCWALGNAGVDNPRSGWSPDLFSLENVIWNRESRTRNQESRLPQSVPYAYPASRVTGNRQLVTGNRQLSTPATADIFGIYFPEKNRIAHAGFIDQWDGTWLITVEGNTNGSGSRDGDGVYRKRRLVRSIYQVARYIN